MNGEQLVQTVRRVLDVPLVKDEQDLRLGVIMLARQIGVDLAGCDDMFGEESFLRACGL